MGMEGVLLTILEIRIGYDRNLMIIKKMVSART